MDFTKIAGYLKIERARINAAIAALEGLGVPSPRRGRLPKAKAAPALGKKRRRMNAAARSRIGAAKKAWWAKQKGKAAPKKAASSAKKRTGRR